jgi:hypothetical protein
MNIGLDGVEMRKHANGLRSIDSDSMVSFFFIFFFILFLYFF